MAHCSRINRNGNFISWDFFHLSSFMHNGDNVDMWCNIYVMYTPSIYYLGKPRAPAMTNITVSCSWTLMSTTSREHKNIWINNDWILTSYPSLVYTYSETRTNRGIEDQPRVKKQPFRWGQLLPQLPIDNDPLISSLICTLYFSQLLTGSAKNSRHALNLRHLYYRTMKYE